MLQLRGMTKFRWMVRGEGDLVIIN
uniref:T4.15 protein n=1 Tax=Rhizophora mucronata TaxID=61149 RepID=A0A2P2Q4S2_RHIMU